MAIMINATTGIALGDPEAKIFQNKVPSLEAVKAAGASLILSVSGWRKIFAGDGLEESRTTELAPADAVLAGLMADCYADFLARETGRAACRVVLGCDSRPTGPALADVMIRVLLARGFEVRYAFIAAAPEIMACVRKDRLPLPADPADGFIYVSASHNPIGHNGVKFGLGEGGVLNARQIAPIIAAFKAELASEEAVRRVALAADRVDPGAIRAVYEAVPRIKTDAAKTYLPFIKRVITGFEDEARQNEVVAALRRGIETSRPGGPAGFGIVADFNGSARALSIDAALFRGLGIRLRAINDKAGQIAHAILPEGPALDACRAALEQAHAEDPRFLLGYMPDCDGDRGNLVYWDDESGRAEILQAQEVFALSTVAELAYGVWAGFAAAPGASGAPGPRAAVVVNDATSLRVERIAEAFGAVVRRAEVGEANVVELAAKTRAEGFVVRLLGEGSNGGNITHPSAVRDPLSTIGAVLKLLFLGRDGSKPGLLELWAEASKTTNAGSSNSNLGTVLRGLPVFATTNASAPEAALRIRTMDHAALKRAFEALFLREWEEKKDELRKLVGAVSYREINFEGTEAKEGYGETYRSGNQRGGLKIVFSDAAGRDRSWIWMRGSGTEPVFRIMAEVEGAKPEAERRLLAWLTSMVRSADAVVTGSIA